MSEIHFEPLGIAGALERHWFVVPPNQREFAWTEVHVAELFQDFAKVMQKDNPTYFLGTIVLTGDEGREVADGQQRLTTVTILLAAIRDYLFNSGDTERIESIEPVYLRKRDLESNEIRPKLRLNLADNEFFTNYVLASPNAVERQVAPSRKSHELIVGAAKLAKDHIANEVANLRSEDQAGLLVRWVKFLHQGAMVILARVPDHLNAFVMFETLNDRGLKASQADLLKNYLLNRAGPRMDEAQERWARMLGVLETLDEKDIAVSYLRHVVILKEGPIKERDVYDKVESIASSQTKAVMFVDSLASSAHQYAASLSASHAFWNSYPSKCQKYIQTLRELQLQQIRALVFAIVREFSPPEVEKALRLCVSWSVRFLISGGGGGGLLDRAYGLAAQRVGTKEIRDAKTLAAAMAVVPGDKAFQDAFELARVSQSYLARYYLRSLEFQAKGEPDPELVPNEEKVLNLEHILPENPGQNWPEWTAELAEGYYKRLGNMVLLQAKKNTLIGNSEFAVKRLIFKDSALVLTQRVGKYKKWRSSEITARQKELAKLAVKTWPISLS